MNIIYNLSQTISVYPELPYNKLDIPVKKYYQIILVKIYIYDNSNKVGIFKI